MKREIWKYKLGVINSQIIVMPSDAQLLSVQVQNDQPCLWALVDPKKAEVEDRTIEIVGTGQEIHYDMGNAISFIDTFQLSGGALVFHVFEREY